MTIIECVPNVSEGRRPEVVETLLHAVRSVGGVRVLDASSGPRAQSLRYSQLRATQNR
jgi:glutamate formiminotransferase